MKKSWISSMYRNHYLKMVAVWEMLETHNFLKCILKYYYVYAHALYLMLIKVTFSAQGKLLVVHYF